MKPSVSGKLKVKKDKNRFSEQARIGICIKSTKSLRTEKEWNQLLQKFAPEISDERQFFVPQSKWFKNGQTWFISTNLFSETEIEIDIEPSALLSTGIQVEIFLRYTIVTKYIKPSATLSAGGKLTLKINWKTVPALPESLPTFETRRFER